MAGSQERRRGAIIPLFGRHGARTDATRGVRLLDLSATGARIGLGGPLQQGSSYALEPSPALGPLSLSTRVMWSGILGGEHTPEGRHLHYHSGLVFVDVTPKQQAALARILERNTYDK